MDDRALDPVRVFVELPDARCLANADTMTEVAVAAEDLGFYGIAVADHLVSDETVATCGPFHDDRGDDRVFFEPLQVLPFIAARTSRVKLLTSVIVLPNRHPVLFAKQIASLDQLSGGRVIVGLGSGALPKRTADVGFNLANLGNIARQEYEAYGVTGDRGKLTDEWVGVMCNMWADEPATFHGEHISYNDLEVYPKPVQRPRPPLWWGGRAEAAKRRVARVGDGWIPSQCPIGVFQSGVADIKRMAADISAPIPRDYGISVWGSIAETEGEAQMWARQTIGSRFQTEDAMWSGTLTGTPETLLPRLAEYRAAGMNLLVLRLVPPTVSHMVRQMRLLSEHVLPVLRTSEPAASAA